MLKKTANPSVICILHADTNTPLKLWDKKIRDGRIKRITENGIKGLALEFTGKVPYCNYLCCPANAKAQLGIQHPYLVSTVKADEFFAFDVQILDDTNTRRRFRFATGDATFEIQPFYCRVPLILENGWNNVVVPLHHLTKEVYCTKYVETRRIQVYPCCLIKKIFFADKDYDDEELPKELHCKKLLHVECPGKKQTESDARANLGFKLHTSSHQGEHPKNICGPAQTIRKDSSFRETISRVIPTNYGLRDPVSKSAKPTYSVM